MGFYYYSRIIVILKIRIEKMFIFLLLNSSYEDSLESFLFCFLFDSKWNELKRNETTKKVTMFSVVVDVRRNLPNPRIFYQNGCHILILTIKCVCVCVIVIRILMIICHICHFLFIICNFIGIIQRFFLFWCGWWRISFLIVTLL